MYVRASAVKFFPRRRFNERWNEVIYRGRINEETVVPGDFGRQWRPTKPTVTIAPGYPGRSPIVARNPDPADAGLERPTPVMIGGPTPVFIRIPRPTVIRIDPVTYSVRTPPNINARGVQTNPYFVLKPAPIRCQGSAKGFDTNYRICMYGHVIVW